MILPLIAFWVMYVISNSESKNNHFAIRFERAGFSKRYFNPIMFGSCSGVDSGDMTASSRSFMKAVLWGLEATKSHQMVICAWVFFSCSSTRSSLASLGGDDFSVSVDSGWYTLLERVICCIQRDAGSDPSEVSDDSGSIDQLKALGEVSVI
ncbi:hypothetical protein LguiB_018293 [Lonicera macranthoides]